MNYQQLKDAIQRNFPETMTYTKAKSVKSGVFNLPLARWVGRNQAHDFSVEVRGPSKKLSRLEFMISLESLERAVIFLKAMTAVVNTAVPDWADEMWLLATVSNGANEERGAITVKHLVFPREATEPLSVAFVTVSL
jgi:hypothetical protein